MNLTHIYLLLSCSMRTWTKIISCSFTRRGIPKLPFRQCNWWRESRREEDLSPEKNSWTKIPSFVKMGNTYMFSTYMFKQFYSWKRKKIPGSQRLLKLLKLWQRQTLDDSEIAKASKNSLGKVPYFFWNGLSLDFQAKWFQTLKVEETGGQVVKLAGSFRLEPLGRFNFLPGSWKWW